MISSRSHRVRSRYNRAFEISDVSFHIDKAVGDKCRVHNYEGLEYDTPELSFLKNDMFSLMYQRPWKTAFLRYGLLFAIGFFTASAAFLIDSATAFGCSSKFAFIQYLFTEYNNFWTILLPGCVWCLISALVTFVGLLLTVLFSPVSSGSGIPQIKCYLNGLNVPFILRARTLLVKAIGVVLAVCGGLLVGKEGPMIHIGAVIAAGISQGRITWCDLSFSSFRRFRNDAEKRDFINAGAAAGVAAAFGSPVGGLLFTLEEGASFIFQRLTWDTLFASMVSMFTLASYRSFFGGHPFNFTSGGLISFGMFESVTSFNFYELLIFVLMGIFGGLLGATFISLNKALTKYRRSNVKTRLGKILDGVSVITLQTSLNFAILILMSDCRSQFRNKIDAVHQVVCSNGDYNRVSTLFFTTPNRALTAILHDPPGSFNFSVLLLFVLCTFCFAAITYGIDIPSGLFLPSLLIGAAWGRVIGDFLFLISHKTFSNPGKFALIGAAAQLGGIVRTIASLTVILMESTGNVILGLPFLITLVCAKYSGDCLTEGIYDVHINLSGMVLVPWEANGVCLQLRALDVMTSPVVVLDPVMSVGQLYHLLLKHPHHSFPVVVGDKDPAIPTHGQLIGVISVSCIALLIKNKIYVPLNCCDSPPRLTANAFDEAYRRSYRWEDFLLNISGDEFNRYIDFRPYMNHAPYRVFVEMSVTRVFTLFRRLGLRHLPVVDNSNQVRGIITRRDLCRFLSD